MRPSRFLRLGALFLFQLVSVLGNSTLLANWTDCSEILLPAANTIGGCQRSDCRVSYGHSTANPDCGCDAWTGFQLSAFNPEIPQSTEKTLRGEPFNGSFSNPEASYIGIHLPGQEVILTMISLVPRAQGSDWIPRPHPYNNQSYSLDWAAALIGAKVQASADGASWLDLYEISSKPSPHPAVTNISIDRMLPNACHGYSFFRLYQPNTIQRIYFVNTEFGPVQVNETIGVVSVNQLHFYGVRAPQSSTNVSCLLHAPRLFAQTYPPPGFFLNEIEVVLLSLVAACNSSFWYTVDDSTPRIGWYGQRQDGGGSILPDRKLEIVPVVLPGTLATVNLQVMQIIVKDGVVYQAPVLSFPFKIPQIGLLSVCPAGSQLFPGFTWCYRAHTLSDAKSFWDAERSCQSEGGHLASVSSQAENDFITSIVREANGLTDPSALLSGSKSMVWIGLYKDANSSGLRWTDYSKVKYMNWIDSMPLHPNKTCSLFGAGDWWQSECKEQVGRNCAGRKWGPWEGRWGDVVGLGYNDEPEYCYHQDTASMVPTKYPCYQPSWVGTASDDPCRQPFGYVCKFTGQIVCAPGYYNESGTLPCSPCAAGEYSSEYNATACASCLPGAFSSPSSAGCNVAVLVSDQDAFPGTCPTCRVKEVFNLTSSNQTNRSIDSDCQNTSNLALIQEYESVMVVSDANQTVKMHISEKIYKQLCCGLQNVKTASNHPVPPCDSIYTAFDLLSAFPSSVYNGTVKFLPGYFVVKETTNVSRSVAMSCENCTSNGAAWHLSDVYAITTCLHSGSNIFSFPPSDTYATGTDNCDPATFEFELEECPQGYSKFPYDLNPGVSEAFLCLSYSQSSKRVSSLYFTQGWGDDHVCTDGYEQHPLDFMDGYGGDYRLRLCILRDHPGMLLDLNISNSSETGNCTRIGYPHFTGPWLCLASLPNSASIFDAKGNTRILNVVCSSCEVSIVGLTFLSGNVLSERLEAAPNVLIENGTWLGISRVCGQGRDWRGMGGSVWFGGSGRYTIRDCSFLNSSAQCGGAVMVANQARATFINCTFIGNVAGDKQNGSGVGGALLAYSSDEIVSVYQLWPSGVWGNPRDLTEMRRINAGRMVGSLAANSQPEGGGVTVRLENCTFSDNWALGGEAALGWSANSSGMSFGGGVAVANGRFDIVGCRFQYNVAGRGDQIAAVGVAGPRICNSDSPPVVLTRPQDCDISVAAVKTRLQVTDGTFWRFLVRTTYFQTLTAALNVTCDAPRSTACHITRTKETGWVATKTSAVPPFERPGEIYLQHVSAIVELSSFLDEEGNLSVSCKLQHTECLRPELNPHQCFAKRFLRAPCCLFDTKCEK